MPKEKEIIKEEMDFGFPFGKTTIRGLLEKYALHLQHKDSEVFEFYTIEAVERAITCFFHQTLLRFIEKIEIPPSEISSTPSKLPEETSWREVNDAYLEGYNQALKDISQKQQQWLKEKL